MKYKLVPIASNIGCKTFCNTAVDFAATDPIIGEHPSIVPWITDIANLRQSVVDGMEAVDERFSVRREAVSKRKACVDKMAITVRDFVATLKRRIYRDKLPDYLFSYYLLPNDNTTTYKKPDQWYALAQKLVRGEAKAISKGFQPMTNPSITELETCMTDYQSLRLSSEQADSIYQNAQEQMDSLRMQVREKANGLITNLRLVLKDRSETKRHRIMRRFGFEFNVIQIVGLISGTGVPTEPPANGSNPSDTQPSGGNGTSSPPDSKPPQAETGNPDTGNNPPPETGGFTPPDEGNTNGLTPPQGRNTGGTPSTGGGESGETNTPKNEGETGGKFGPTDPATNPYGEGVKARKASQKLSAELEDYPDDFDPNTHEFPVE